MNDDKPMRLSVFCLLVDAWSAARLGVATAYYSWKRRRLLACPVTLQRLQSLTMTSGRCGVFAWETREGVYHLDRARCGGVPAGELKIQRLPDARTYIWEDPAAMVVILPEEVA